jgi:hypothetical protein
MENRQTETLWAPLQRRKRAFGAFLLACLAVSSRAAGPAADPGWLRIEALRVDGGVDRAGGWVLYLDGPFEAGADRRLEDFLDRQGIGSAQVYFNSPGGSLVAGMAVGRLLRARGFTADVGRRAGDPRRPSAGVCYSACPFAYAGGVHRRLREGSVLGVHRARNRVPVPDEAAFERRVEGDAHAYLREMGVDPGLVAIMQETPPGGIRLLDAGELKRLGLVTPAPAK